MIITLCGSARFEEKWVEWNRMLTLSGHVVLGLAVFPSQMAGNKDWYTPEQKVVLDLIHRRKIDVARAIVVLNAEGYIGESTRGEVEWARLEGKPVFYIEDPRTGGRGSAYNLLGAGVS